MIGKDALEMAKKWGIFAVLFVSLLIFVLTGYEKREDKLMDFIIKQSEINVQVAGTLERMYEKLNNIEDKIWNRGGER